METMSKSDKTKSIVTIIWNAISAIVGLLIGTHL